MQTAVVTGASKGIGRAIALTLSSRYRVVALARDGAALQSLAQTVRDSGGECLVREADLRKAESIANALEGISADVLINNAGVMFKNAFVDQTPEEWHAMIDVNLNAIYYVTRALLPGMLERQRGYIVNIASIAGKNALPGAACYAATKHALIGLSESLMLEVRDRGVRVSCVLPGSVATELSPGGSKNSWALRPDDVAKCVSDLLTTPAHALVHMVEVRASQPKKP